MAYNPTIYQPYGQMYGNYGQGYSQIQQPQYAPQTQPQTQAQTGMIWVDGEVGAKAYQLPAGWPMNTPLPLWDTNDTIIYLKSTNQMGIPNPIQKIHYKMDEQQKPIGQSGGMQQSLTSGTESAEYMRRDEADGFVRKEDLERMKTELMESIHGISAQSGAKRTAKEA